MDFSPQRVVALQPSATAILRDLGKLDRLVACTRYCVELCPELADLTQIVADSWTAQSEQIKAARADLVIASVPYQDKAVSEIMKSGARFLGLAPKSLNDIYGDIAVIAAIFDAPDRGRAVISEMRAEIQAVRTQASHLPRRRVFCEEWGKPLIASQLWVAELVEAAGGKFIGTPGAKTSFDQVKEAQPEVLIAAWCGAGDRVPLKKVIDRRNWGDMPAAKTGRVYCIRDEFLNTPAPTLLHGLRALAAATHPDCFPQWLGGLRCISDPGDSALT
jgi:iron complex transport system substrate-binding protein